MNIETIKEFIEWSEDVPWLPYLDVYTGAWRVNGYNVSWGLCADMKFKYSSEIRSRPLRKDGLALINMDNGWGETSTMVFLESEEVK